MQPRPRGPALSVTTIVLAAVCLTVGALWIRKASLIAFTILVGEGTPPVPALATLVFLTVAGFLWHRLTKTSRWRRQSLLVYLILTTALVTIDANGVRQLLAQLTSLRYFAAPGNDYASFADLLPRWFMPSGPEAIRSFYEGSGGGAIPWSDWGLPLAVWGAAFMLFTLSLGCLVSLFRQPWADHERLTFPLAELALQLAPEPSERGPELHLLRNPLFWAGIGVAVCYNASNIAHAFSPGVMAIGQSYNFDALLTERPWTALRTLNMTFRPEIVGLGYLVPVDVLLSVWGFYILLRCENLGAELFGYAKGGFPFDRAQAMGGYLGLACFILYSARGHLGRVARAAFGGPPPEGDREEALPARLAFWGVVIGITGMTVFCLAAGMGAVTAIAYVLLFYAAVLVYVRVRSQTGLPITYIVPREDLFEAVYALTPSSGHLSRLQLRSETAFSVLAALARMTFPQLTAFQMEGIRVGDRARIKQGHLMTGLTLGLLGGLVVATYLHLHAAYAYGWNVIDGGTTDGGYRTWQALAQYQRLQTRAFTRVPVEINTNVARLVGLAVTLGMVWLRVRFLRFPLNPLGLALAGTFGSPIWFPIFLAWLSKTLILRLGGAHTYRRLTPVFLGIALGQFFIAGGIWGLVGAFNEEVAKRYLVWFA